MEESFQAIGTTWHIRVYDELRIEARRLLFADILARIEQFEATYSRFRTDSFLASVSGVTGKFLLPPDARELFNVYYTLYQLTDGAFTPLIGSVLEEAGYDREYSLKERNLHVPPRLEIAIEYDFPHITIHSPVRFDVGAAGKGYLVDIVSDMLTSNGCERYFVDAGGDIRHNSLRGEMLRVGLEHPLRADEAIGVVSLGNQSICGSAGNRRRWGRFHHTIDPTKLESPEHISAIWVVATEARVADALTTCLYFVAAEKLRSKFQFEYLLVRQDGSIERSEQFPAELF